MEPQFFSILGTFPTRERALTGLNDPASHHGDETWKLGEVPDSLVNAFRRPRPAPGARVAPVATEEVRCHTALSAG